MTAKKHTLAPATAHRTKKAHKNNVSKTASVSIRTSIPSEPVVAEATESAIHPTLEPLPTATTMPIPVEQPPQTPTEEPSPGEAASIPTATTTRLSALEAALRVLAESGQAMNCQELIAAMAAKNYWRSPKGRTPAGTLYACFVREMKIKGDKARMIKTTHGTFALRPAV